MNIELARQKSKRAFRPAIDDLERRQLMSTAHFMVHELAEPAVVHLNHEIPRAGHGEHAGDRTHAQHASHANQPGSRTTRSDSTVQAPQVGLHYAQNSTPSLVQYDDELWTEESSYWGGQNNRIVLGVSSDGGQTFHFKLGLVQYTETTAPLAVFDGNLYLAFTGTDNRLNVYPSSQGADGLQFKNKVTLPDTSEYAPALAVGNELYIAWTGMDHHINIESSSDGVHWGNKVTLPVTTWAAPALSSNPSGGLTLAWVGDDPEHHLNLESSPDGVHWDNKVTLPENHHIRQEQR